MNDKYTKLLALVLSNLIITLDPEQIIIGGGLANIDFIFRSVPKKIPNLLLENMDMPHIYKRKFENSGSRGAALLPLFLKDIN